MFGGSYDSVDSYKTLNLARSFEAIVLVPKGEKDVLFCKDFGLVNVTWGLVHYMPCYTNDAVVLGVYKVRDVGKSAGGVFTDLVARSGDTKYVEADRGERFYHQCIGCLNDGETEVEVERKYASVFKLGECQSVDGIRECEVESINGDVMTFSGYSVDVDYNYLSLVGKSESDCSGVKIAIEGRAMLYSTNGRVLVYLHDGDTIMVADVCGDLNVFAGRKMIEVSVGV